MKIWKHYNRKTRKYEWRARFECNRKTFRPVEDTQEKLLILIGEIRKQEKDVKDVERYKVKREIVEYVPPLSELLDEVLQTIQRPHQQTLAERVFNDFLELLPPEIKVNEIDKTHFQKYIDRRLSQHGKQSKKPITRSTVYRELYLVTGALGKAELYYNSLKSWQVPQLPKPPKNYKRKSKRERLVTAKEFNAVIGELMKSPTGKQTKAHHFSRVRLAHQIEFGFWTGLRRKEICGLKFSQYDEDQNALLNVKRWKTETVTKFFPLSKRAAKIIKERRTLQPDTDFLFTPDGKPIESNYRTLKKICEELEISYGRFTDGGFVAHDLRHNFGTDILQNSDIETARELLGHSDISQTGTYVHTSKDRLREAVRKRDKFNYDEELKGIFKKIEKGEIKEPEFIDRIKKLFDK